MQTIPFFKEHGSYSPSRRWTVSMVRFPGVLAPHVSTDNGTRIVESLELQILVFEGVVDIYF